jgi:hypothetical protein
MEEMIDISAKGWSEQNPEMSFEQAKVFLQQFIPNLERWRK